MSVCMTTTTIITNTTSTTHHPPPQGMVPVDKPIIFGGGRKYEKDYTFKQVIGHIIPGR